MIWLLFAPGLTILALFTIGLAFDAHQWLRLPRRYRFLAYAAPVSPDDYRCRERLRIILLKIQSSRDRFGMDDILDTYEAITKSALENATRESLLQLNGIRLSLLRKANGRG